MTSFDYDLKTHIHRAKAATPPADYPKPEVNETLEALMLCHRRMVQATAVFCLSIGFVFGMAAVAAPVIFGGA